MDDKLHCLQTILRDLGGAAVAFSGGRDSALLLAVAARALPRRRVVALLGVSPLLHARERAAAAAVAAHVGVPLQELPIAPLSEPGIVANGPDRCYHCKHMLLSHLLEKSRTMGLALVEGSHRDDDPALRPGSRALHELSVRSPLREAGLGRASVNALSLRLGLPTADRASESCLATRIPTGTRLDAALLACIESAEDILVAAGFAGCRARHHGDLLRVEVAAADFPRISRLRVRTRLGEKLRALGWRYVTLDMAGYGENT